MHAWKTLAFSDSLLGGGHPWHCGRVCGIHLAHLLLRLLVHGAILLLLRIQRVRAEIQFGQSGVLLHHGRQVRQRAHSQVVARDVERLEVFVPTQILKKMGHPIVLATVQSQIQDLAAHILGQMRTKMHASVRVHLVIMQVQVLEAVVLVQHRGQAPCSAIANLIVTQIEVCQHVPVRQTPHQHLDQLVIYHVARQRQRHQCLGDANIS
mmetsp:Transcript_29026/g.76563  ORF Transcript_29026/g.76563 Transcript_29026/m.76563 type:complete len:209 (+) Transcript_29026:340-966(+)